MLRKSSLFMCVIVLAASLGAVSTVQAVSWSLADDFSLAANSGTTTWSYWTFKWDSTYQLLSTNTRTASDLGSPWTPISNAPLMWSDATGNWGIGKNTGTTTLAGGNGLSWAPGEVMFQEGIVPAGPPNPAFGDLAVSWLAPSTMQVNIAETITREMTGGDSVAYRIIQRSGAVDTELVGFNHITGTVIGDSLSYSQTNLNVLAGDRLFFQIDGWADHLNDVTKLSITVTPVPEPSMLALLGCALAGLLAYAWRKRK